MEKITDTISENISDLSSGIKLSQDGTSMLGCKAKRKNNGFIRIPSGVTKIEDYALEYVKFSKLYINKELEYLGKYTFCNRYGDVKEITHIEVDPENKHFFTDEIGLYSAYPDGTKRLEYVFNHEIESYSSAPVVTSFGDGAFGYCSKLKQIKLNEDVKDFTEACLPIHSLIKEIFIPSTVQHLLFGTYPYYNSRGKMCIFRVDESSDYFFNDEDSIYEVLSDGTYKLIKCMYYGKGRVLILDGTSVIGDRAFERRKTIEDLELPESVRVIGKHAFSETELKELVIPTNVSRVEEGAFASCHELMSVQIPADIDYISEDAFENCGNLTIKSDGKNKAFSYEYGKLFRLDKKAGEQIEKDLFAEYAQKIVEMIACGSVYGEYRGNDHAEYDDGKRVVFVTTAIEQYHNNPAIVEKRIACAEKLRVGDAVYIRMNLDRWEAFSTDGESLGETSPGLAMSVAGYVNNISVINGKIVDITPKSMRRKNAKYALATISFEVIEKKIPKGISRKDLDIMNHFLYSIDDTEAHILRWIWKRKGKKAVIPSKIEGMPVITLSGNIFQPDYKISMGENVEEIVISNGIRRIESSVLFNGYHVKKVIFPRTIEYISNDVFTDEDGCNKDLFLREDTVYVAPKGSYAEKFLKEYKPKHFYITELTVVNEE